MKKIKPLLLYVFNFVDPRKKNYFGSDLLKKSVCYCSLKVIAKKVKSFIRLLRVKYANILKGRGVAVSKEGGAEEEEEGKDKAVTPSHSESTPLQEYLSFCASLFLLGFL